MSDHKGPAPAAGRLGRIIERGGGLFAAGIALAALILLSEVFLRYALGSPTVWAHETTTFLCGLAFLYGGLLCVARDSHVRVVLIYDLLPPRARRIMDVALSLLSVVASLFFAWAAWVMAGKALWTPAGDFRPETSGSAWNPPTPALVKVFLLVMLIVMAVQFLIIAINTLRGTETPE